MAFSDKKNPQNDKKQQKLNKAFLVIVSIVLVLVILFCVGLIVIQNYLNKIGKIDSNIDIVLPENQDFEVDEEDSIDPNVPVVRVEDVEWWEEGSIDDDDLVNILLVGQDTRGNTRERSDVMILCSINTKTGEVAIGSFLRDLYVQIPGYNDNRMNAAYAFGGFPLLYDVFEANFGITCDGGIEVDFKGFKEIVDLIGGVDLELTNGEAAIVGVYPGVNHLNGEQALSYARIRKLDSDFGRTSRQRNVLNAILNKVRYLSTTELLNLVNSCLNYITTDMTNSQIIDVAMVTLPLVSNLQLKEYRIPTDDGYYNAYIRGMAVLVPDLKLAQNYLKEDFLPLSD